MSDLKIFSDDIPINGKRVIVRLDLNVPISNSKIDDGTRIKVVETFINKLIQNKAKVILLSHLGRPKGRVVSEMSLTPIFNYLEKKLNGKIYFYLQMPIFLVCLHPLLKELIMEILQYRMMFV